MIYKKVENNPFSQIYVDLTYKCNMNCNICYNAKREKDDMSLEYFTEVCKRLPNRVVFRFLGGEPTMHPQIFEFIEVARKYKHFVSLITNGKKISDYNFAKELKKVNVKSLMVSISFDGGIENDTVYQVINNEPCAAWKMKALENLYMLGFHRVAVCAIVVRDLNEFVINDLLKLHKKYKRMIRHIHLRTMAKIRSYIESEPYTIQEIKKLLKPYFPNIESPYKLSSLCGDLDCGGCDRFWIDKNLEISLIEFATEKSINCKIRGKLLDNFVISPWFEEMKTYGN